MNAGMATTDKTQTFLEILGEPDTPDDSDDPDYTDESDDSDDSGASELYDSWNELDEDAFKIRKASKDGETETLRLLLANSSNASELILRTDGGHATALHYAKNSDIAKVLVESVVPDKQRNLLSATAKIIIISGTALDVAVFFDRVDVVEYLVGLASADQSLLDGQPLPIDELLHYTRSARVTKILVESVHPDRRTSLLLRPGGYLQRTSLHTLVMDGMDEVVEYLCSLSITELLQCKDRKGNTALHYARTKNRVQMLIESVPEPLRRDYILNANEDQQTVLHGAVMIGYDRVVEYLCNLSIVQLLLSKDRRGNTALHCARTKKTVQLLAEALPEGMRENVMCELNNKQQTALHTIVAHPHTQLSAVDCYLNVVPRARQLLLMLDVEGRTALHYSQTKDIADLLINTAEDKSAYVNITDHAGRTALHYAHTREIAHLLIGTVQDKSAYLNIIDDTGRSALHYADTRKKARLLMETAADKSGYINIADHEGHKAVMHMTVCGLIDTLEYTLDYIENHIGVSELKNTLLRKNMNGQNIFHLTSISPLAVDLLEILIDYIDVVKIENVLVPDVFNNTPFIYLAGRFSSSLFAKFILKIPLWERRNYIMQRNKQYVNCLTLSEQKEFKAKFYLKSILCKTNDITYSEEFQPIQLSRRFTYAAKFQPEEYVKYDEDIFKVMKYAMNEYSLLDIHIATQNKEDFVINSHLIYRQSCKPSPSFEQTDEGLTESSSLIWFYFDVALLTTSEIQRRLYILDVPENHGKPKVIVVRHPDTAKITHVSPPGPDFIIISVVSGHSDLFSAHLKIDDIDDLLCYLKSNDVVKTVHVNSTLARHHRLPNRKLTEHQIFLRGESKGKALIICNTQNRDNWEVEHKHACCVLDQQFGLQVTALYDLTADTMLIAISDFSKSFGHGSLTALVILSHGGSYGKICGNDNESMCSVQEVVDALCQPELQFATKMVFLSFCRGSLGKGRSNRTFQSWECATLPRIVDLMSFSPVRKHTSGDELRNERQRRERLHPEPPFPSANAPVNCYICFSTLPDSVSFRYNRATGQRNMMFEGLSDYLTGLYIRRDHLEKMDTSTQAVNNATDTEVSVIEMDRSSPNEHASAASSRQQLPRVELVSLLTDVSGLVREKSDFTQYLNYCYTLSKESKSALVEIFPANVP